MLNDNIKAGQKILKRSGVCPSGHMDSSGVASACNLDTRSQTFTWMGLNVSVCVCMCLCMHMCHSGSMCPFVRGPWHLLMKKSSQRVLPRLQAALLPRESFSPVCHIGCWSLCFPSCLPVCLSLVRSLPLSMPQFQDHSL